MDNSDRIHLVVDNSKSVLPSSPHVNADIVTQVTEGRRAERKMADLTREEMNAKLEAVESRLDAKLADISADIKLLTVSINNLGGNVQQVKDDNKNTRWTVIITIVTSILAAGAALLSVQSNLLSAFETGITISQAPPQNNAVKK